MFATTIINFLFFSLSVGTAVVLCTVTIRKMFILDTDYQLSEKPELVASALKNTEIAYNWAECLPVSSNVSLLDSVSTHARWR